MKRSVLGALVGLVTVAVGCADKVTEPALRCEPDCFVRSPSSVLSAKGQPLQNIRLRVTISDVDPTGVPYAIQSDGLGDYVDGAQNVSAYISSGGLLQFDTYMAPAVKGNKQPPPGDATRYMTFNFNDPVDPSNTYRPSPSNTKNYHWAMKSTPVPLQNVGVNGNPSTVCTSVGGSFSRSSESWRFAFNVQSVDEAYASFVVVTRTSTSPAVWTMTPVGSCSPNSDVGSLRASDTGALYGFYRLPFFFTLRQLQ